MFNFSPKDRLATGLGQGGANHQSPNLGEGGTPALQRWSISAGALAL